MGKKSLRRSRGTKQSICKSSDPSTGKKDKSNPFHFYVDSVAEQLATFPISQNEGCGQLMIRLINFWACGTSERGVLAWTVASFCSTRFYEEQSDIIFMWHIMRKMLGHLNNGEFELARVWMLTFYILAGNIYARTEAEWLRSRNRMIDDINMNDKELQHMSAKILQEKQNWTTPESAYYYSKSVCRMTQWVLFTQSVTSGHLIFEDRVNICIVYYTDSGLRTEWSICVDSSIKLKTLLWRLQGELKVDLENHKMTFQDGCGLAKGSLIMKYSGDKTLEHIGFENNDVLQIVNANATNVECAMRSFLKDTPRVQARQRAKKRGKKQSMNVATHKNISKSPSRSTTKPNSSSKKQGQPTTVKPRISGSKKQDDQNQTSYCSNIDQDRLNHSTLLTLVFEEATELFQTRRQRLNELSLKKCKPKQKYATLKPKTSASEPGSHCCLPETGGKAGKSVFPVVVGHQEYLYKSSKHKRHVQNSPFAIDLHGCTREEALIKLNNSLPFWINEAMKESPWIVGVNIIAGGGNQIVAESVEHWIREKRNVANRFN
jgi:DNA-nicking Smr family endonuclease